MKIRVIGGGPAGLFYAYLMKRGDPAHDIRVYERDPESATYGWGVVLSDVALAFVRELAPDLYESMTRNQEVFDEMAVVHQGRHVALAHNTFHRMARIDLLKALHAHCREVGVPIEFERRFDDVAAFTDADLIVAADGANSAIRTRYRTQFQPSLDERPNLLAWYGTTRLFDPLSLIFRQNEDGGDALRTGHPSVGSGTRLAMQDSIALFDAYKACGPDVPKLLAEFVRIRQPGSDSLQNAAIKSTEWYENLGPKLHLDPISFAYDYVTRSGRVDHAEVRKRDPELAAAYEWLHPEL